MAVARGPPRPRDALAASRLLLDSTFPSTCRPRSPPRRASATWWCGGGGRPGPAAAGQGRGDAEGSQSKFINHLKWIMTRLMDQVMERHYTLKYRDEKKDKGTTRRVVITPCQLCGFSPWSLPLECALTAVIHAPYWASIGNLGMDCMNK
ncbi:dexamethasone-induced protein isoform X1 [Accipiter gentilis]|uniref:dexamethasone-induced protein isoform X1 n=1 Tax=Astur gentilis TaxID=8957 RepID=UPI002110BDAA|nr:dexamethasone-induced protein isoform X1 [Accipiter gentilis]